MILENIEVLGKMTGRNISRIHETITGEFVKLGH